MRKVFAICLFVLCLSVASFAKPCNKAKETHHTIKVGSGLKKVGHAVAKGTEAAALGVFDTLEASVDLFGVGLQGGADLLDMYVATPLEAAPEPLEGIGDGVHVLYLGIDKVGEFLAK